MRQINNSRQLQLVALLAIAANLAVAIAAAPTGSEVSKDNQNKRASWMDVKRSGNEHTDAAAGSSSSSSSSNSDDEIEADKKASWMDVKKKASWMDVKKKASWMDVKRASWMDVKKRASWMDVKRASWMDVKRNAGEKLDKIYLQRLAELMQNSGSA